MRDVTELISNVIGLVIVVAAMFLWFRAVAYDYKSNETMLVAIWVLCPPCGVIRGGYLVL